MDTSRDLPAIIEQHVRGKRALDFGCGAGRSTRFLRKLGFRVFGVDIADARPVEDIVCPDKDYRKLYAEAGLELIETYKPLGKTTEPVEWVSETRIAPWVIYVLKVGK